MKKVLCIAVLLCCCLAPVSLVYAEEVVVAPGAIDLTPLLQAVLMVLGALITHRLVPWIKARTTAQQQSNLLAAVNTFVYGAEQVFGAGKGAEKLAYVQNALKDAGYSVDASEVMATVEAMVKYMQDSAGKE